MRVLPWPVVRQGQLLTEELEPTEVNMLSLAFLGILFILYLLSRSEPRLPPGPRPLPILGNLHQAPRKNSWLEFKKWHEQYGPIVSFKLGQQVYVLLGTHKAARDLLDKRSSIYSTRPRSIVAGECVTKGLGTVFLPYGARWKTHHQIQGEFLNQYMTKQYSVLQDVETRQVVYDLIHTNDFDSSFHRMAASLVFALAYGKRFPDGDEDEIREVTDLMKSLIDKMTPGKWMVDVFPVLNHLPRILAPWKRIGDEMHHRESKLFIENTTKAQKTPNWNWSKHAMGLKKINKLSATELGYIIGILYQAGSDTTSVTLCDVVVACLLHPDAVRKAQEELDSVIGQDRLPEIDDMANIPYTIGFLQEVMRLRPITPVGMPHATTQDDEYMGYHIPKGATVMPNYWTMAADEDVFDDPGSFMPERWIKNPKLPFINFGFGRRVCTGRHIAMNTLRLTVSRILWAYNIGHAYENGKRLEVDPLARTQDTVSKPSPFKAEFKVRSQGHREVVERSWMAAEKNLEVILEGVGPKSQ